MNDLNKYIKKQLKNKEFKEEWEKSEIEYQIVHALIDAREKNNYTQQQLAALTGISINKNTSKACKRFEYAVESRIST